MWFKKDVVVEPKTPKFTVGEAHFVSPSYHQGQATIVGVKSDKFGVYYLMETRVDEWGTKYIDYSNFSNGNTYIGKTPVKEKTGNKVTRYFTVNEKDLY